MASLLASPQVIWSQLQGSSIIRARPSPSLAPHKSMIHSPNPRILISRMSAIGDTILTLPVACALREQFPAAHIAWVVERKSSPVVADHPDIDQVIVVERGWYVKPRQIASLREQLKGLNTEVAIDCQSVTKSGMACLLSGARHRIGLRGRYGSELSPWLNNVLIDPIKPHLTDRSLELTAPLGITAPRVKWKLLVSDSERSDAQRALRTLGIDGPYNVINPGAGWDSRLWEMRRFAEVARHLGLRHDLPSIVIWGGERELGWANRIVCGSRGHAALAPRTSIKQAIAIIEEAEMFVSGDTGPLHMAVAVGTPSVGLHGATRAENSGAYGWPHVSVQACYEDGGRKKRRSADNSAMLEISAAMVCDACDRLRERVAADAKPEQAA